MSVNIYTASIEGGELVIDGKRYRGETPDYVTCTATGGVTIEFPSGTVHSWDDAIAAGWLVEVDSEVGAGPAGVPRGTVVSTPDPGTDTGLPGTDMTLTGEELDMTTLLAEVEVEEDSIAELAHWLSTQTWSEFAVSLAEFYADRGYLTPKQIASATSMRAKIEAKAKPKAPAITEDGMYRHPDGTIYKVQVAVHGSGRLYAKRLVIPEDDGVNATFEMEHGGISRLTPDMKMTLEEAQGFGTLYGMCCVCGAILTDDSPGGSIENGIGPVCAKRFR